MAAPHEPKPIWQLELRPGMRGTPEFRMLVEALLSAAREELEWAEQAAERREEVRHDAA